jgi:cytidylate kinase
VSFIVAIDGPAGAGKSTIATGVANRMGFTHVDTGALYRAVTLAAMERHAADDALGELTRDLDVHFDGDQVLLGERDVTRRIRDTDVTAHVSQVSAQPAVREALLELQRRLGRADPHGAVLEGRDIGTVVFPDAELKVFLTASAEERARRRHAELTFSGDTASFDEVLEDLERRDRYDSTRPVAPLVQAPDAQEVDTTYLSIDQVIQRIVDLVMARRR